MTYLSNKKRQSATHQSPFARARTHAPTHTHNHTHTPRTHTYISANARPRWLADPCREISVDVIAQPPAPHDHLHRTAQSESGPETEASTTRAARQPPRWTTRASHRNRGACPRLRAGQASPVSSLCWCCRLSYFCARASPSGWPGRRYGLPRPSPQAGGLAQAAQRGTALRGS